MTYYEAWAHHPTLDTILVASGNLKEVISYLELAGDLDGVTLYKISDQGDVVGMWSAEPLRGLIDSQNQEWGTAFDHERQ
jgi:hypothetical protein